MKISWSSQALEDLAHLQAYIAKDSPAAAQRVALKIIMDVELLLPNHPALGRPGRIAGTRELVISKTPYIVPYRISNGVLQILRVYHGSRRWPDGF